MPHPAPASASPASSEPVPVPARADLRVHWATFRESGWQWVGVGTALGVFLLLASAAHTPYPGLGIRADSCTPDTAHAAVHAWLHPVRFWNQALAATPVEGSPWSQCRPRIAARIAAITGWQKPHHADTEAAPAGDCPRGEVEPAGAVPSVEAPASAAQVLAVRHVLPASGGVRSH